MHNLKIHFLAAAFLAVLAPAAPAMSEDAFNAAVDRISESTRQISDAQAKRSLQRKADAAAHMCSPAQIDAAYAALPLCEASLKKAFGVGVRDFKGALKKGFSRDGLSLVLLTTTDAFFYHEDCDICPAVERCSLKDGSVSTFKTSHGVGCLDLAPFLKKNVAYSACPLRP
ncbi:MAG: hypothetical protein Q8T11_05900 [Elusimicrobiota bacterium]|nr:hypothetical protein [Elusimicrobiota bacterium]